MANAWALPASRSPGATPDENVILHVSAARDYDLARQMMEALNRSSFAISGPGKRAAFHVRITPPYLRLPWNKRSSLPEGDPLRMGSFTLYEACGVMPTVIQRTTYLFGDHGDVIVSRPFTDLPDRRREHGTYAFKDGRMTMRLVDASGQSVESTHEVSMPRAPLVRISNALEGCNETLFAPEEFASGCAEE